MIVPRRSFVLGAAAVVLAVGCVTPKQLRRANDANASAIASERAERVATDSALRQELGGVRGDVQALRTDLEAMKTEFGAKITAMEDGLHFAMPVNFAFNAAAVRDQDVASLQRFARIARRYYPQSKVTIEGFADPAGSARYNLDLSRRRADAVRQYLIAQGLPQDQVSSIGYGKTRLVAPGASHDQPGAELNRRVVFVIETAGQRAVALTAPETMP